ncbi:hypothetical protein [Spirosoma utsteinense]|uniref:hypothetical protein n=1 Tax=Spirosoma utsteinense TaxID=2585773 RepID=UPI001648926E|nr:hypothetical protein [Spirosoma utsteinense]MBC3785744.1 hypothetical protein [Spirosoma utsteinense]
MNKLSELQGQVFIEDEREVIPYSDAMACFNMPFTGSIQDAELEEAVIEAFQKHGSNLAGLIRAL